MSAAGWGLVKKRVEAYQWEADLTEGDQKDSQNMTEQSIRDYKGYIYKEGGRDQVWRMQQGHL